VSRDYPLRRHACTYFPLPVIPSQQMPPFLQLQFQGGEILLPLAPFPPVDYCLRLLNRLA
jgi:hypothetical protein